MKKLKSRYTLPVQYLTLKNIAAEVINYYEAATCTGNKKLDAKIPKLTQKMVIDKLTDSFCKKLTIIYFGIRNEQMEEDADSEILYSFLIRNKFLSKNRFL